MRRALSLGILAVLATAPPVHAGDFTGAYAGVNAGYGFDQGRQTKKPIPAPVQNATTSNADELPPSAAIAAKSLRQVRSATQR